VGELIGRVEATWTRGIQGGGESRRGVLLLAGGTAAGQLLNWVVAPALTRVFTPEDFGVSGVFASIFSLLLIVACARLELAIPLASDSRDAVAVAILAILTTAVFSVTLGSALWVWARPLAMHTGVEQLVPYLWLLPFALVGGGLYQVGSYWATRARAFDAVARTKLPQSATQALVPFVVRAVSAGPLGLMLGSVMGHVVGASALLCRFWRDARGEVAKLRLRDLVRALRLNAHFPLVSTWSGLINSAGLYVPGLLLAHQYGPVALGGFVLSQRIMGMPMTLVGQATAQVYVGEAAVKLRERPSDLAALYRSISRRLLVWGAVPIGICTLVAVPTFTLAFGEEWREAGRFAQVLGVAYLAQLCVVPVSQTLTILGRAGTQFAWDCARLVGMIAAFATARTVGTTAVGAVGAYAVVMTAFYVLLWLLGDRASRTVGPTEVRDERIVAT
jgi:O-antigen/teichoic acid export membrane protein